MSAIDPQKRAIYEELMKRRAELPPAKQAVLDELGKRFGATPDFSTVQSGSSVRQADPSIGSPRGNALMGMGIVKGVGELANTGNQWLTDLPRQMWDVVTGKQNPFSPKNAQDASPSRVPNPQLTSTGADLTEALTTPERAGKGTAKTAAAIAAALAAGPTLPAQVAAGGISGAMMSPDNPYPASAIGMAAPIVGAGVEKGASMASALARGTGRASAKFDQVSAAAKNVPLNLSKADDIALEAKELQEAGNTLPRVFSAYLRQREKNPQMLFEFGRKVASKAGDVTAAERAAYEGAMQRQLAMFTRAMKDANREAAVKAGVGPIYDEAMKEYARAKSAEEAAEIIAKWAKRVAITFGLGTAGGMGLDFGSEMLSR